MRKKREEWCRRGGEAEVKGGRRGKVTNEKWQHNTRNRSVQTRATDQQYNNQLPIRPSIAKL